MRVIFREIVSSCSHSLPFLGEGAKAAVSHKFMITRQPMVLGEKSKTSQDPPRRRRKVDLQNQKFGRITAHLRLYRLLPIFCEE